VDPSTIISQNYQQVEIKTEFDKIIEFGKRFIGKPYRYRINNFGSLDCSTFIAYIFNNFGYILPRDPDEQYLLAKKIALSEIKKGDLLFFKGSSIKSKKIGHVGIVADVISDTIMMLHSCNRGILIENYNSLEYYRKRFIGAGRIETADSTSRDSSLMADSTYLNINAVGDIMLGSNFPSLLYLPPNDGKNIFDSTKYILANSDITFGNLEGVFLSKNVDTKKKVDSLNVYAFKSPDHYINYLLDARFNLLSIANNHIGDFGLEGIANTIKLLKQNNINFAGLITHPYSTFTIRGNKIGFVAFSINSVTLNAYDTTYAKEIINKLNDSCDIVIVSMHLGAEGSMNRHLTNQEEIFLGEKRGYPVAFAKFAIDNGADLILGHGPHVLRAVEVYKNKFIAYSLGNFFTYGRFNINDYRGRGVIINIKIDRDGNFIYGKIFSTIQTKSGKLLLDKNNYAINDILQLTNRDIKNSNLIINNNGEIFNNYKNKR